MGLMLNSVILLLLAFLLSQTLVPELVGHPWFPIARYFSQTQERKAVERERSQAEQFLAQLQTSQMLRVGEQK